MDSIKQSFLLFGWNFAYLKTKGFKLALMVLKSAELKYGYSAVRKLLICTMLFIGLASCRRNLSEAPNDSVRADSILQKADDLLNAGHLKEAVYYLDSAYREFRNAGPVDQWKRYSCLRNFYLNYDLNIAKANLYADSMFLALKGTEQKYKHEYAQSIFARGDVLRAEKRLNEAFNQYYEGRQYALKNLDTCEFAGFTYKLGLIRYSQEDFLKAISYFKQALREYAKCGSSDTFEFTFIAPQSIYNSIALGYEQAGMPDSALYHYHQGLEFIERSRHNYPKRKAYMEMAMGVISGNLGGQYARLDRYTEGEKYLKQSIAYNDREGYAREDALTAKNKLATMYIKQNRLNEAKGLIDAIDQYLANWTANNHERQSIQLSILKLKSAFYEKKGDYRQAFVFLTEWDALKDSVSLVLKNLKKTDMDAAFREAEQSHRLELSKKNGQIKTFYLLGAILVSMLAGGFLVMVWFNLRRTRGHVAQLTSLNKQVTEQNTQLNDTLRILEQSQQENARLVRVVAHDLRNPIGAVQMLSALMLHKKQFEQADKEMLEMIKKSAVDSLLLVDDLLRPKEMTGELKKQPEDIYQILRFCVNQLSTKADDKQQRIELEGGQVMAPVNAEQLWRVVSNLISNSIKFSPRGKVIGVKLSKGNSSVLIAVEDQGIGIPEELQSKLFDMPDETKRKGTAGEETFGLGLAISRQIVLAHGGKIWFKSGTGVGTTFYVELPL